MSSMHFVFKLIMFICSEKRLMDLCVSVGLTFCCRLLVNNNARVAIDITKKSGLLSVHACS